MTKSTGCAWCGEDVGHALGRGRPRIYCRRSHRQRAFEARRRAHRLGLSPTEAVVPAEGYRGLLDRIYVLESALRDVERDLRAVEDPAEYQAAFRHLYAAAAGVRGVAPDPIAIL